MADDEQKFPWFRFLAVALISALFVADYVFDILAKAPPMWAYAVLGLLALGIEAPAIGRLIMQLMRAAGKVSEEEDKK